MLAKNYYYNASLQNEIIAMHISAFLTSGKIILNQDGRCPQQFMFNTNHFHREASFDSTDSDKGQISLHNFYKKDIYSPKLEVTLLQVFPNLFPYVYFKCIIVNKLRYGAPLGRARS